MSTVANPIRSLSIADRCRVVSAVAIKDDTAGRTGRQVNVFSVAITAFKFSYRMISN